ncbi:MAG: type I polyketide synthase [Chitinophagales bacterium]
MDSNNNANNFPKNTVAIVGIGLRLPGDIQYLSDFWTALINKKDLLTTIPENRFPNLNQYIDANRGKGKMVTKRGGFLSNIQNFDANFFNIAPTEAEKLDPQQRLLLETAFEAFEDAGIRLEDMYGSNTGVYCGSWSNDFEHKMAKSNYDIDAYTTTGSGRYALSGRLSYFFNIQGPSLTIDTACSTSIVALHTAIQSLKLNEIDTALVGAVNLIQDPFVSIGYSRSSLLSDYGECRFGNLNASGYVRSEAAVTIVIKRLEDAIKDNNFIHAVVLGSACNSDGHAHKYMLAPSDITQKIMLDKAIKSANIKSNQIQFVEAHGTGTKAGDKAELNSIWNAFDDGNRNEILVGSVKSNLGHTEAVAGLVGLVKTCLAIQHKKIPANLHFLEPNNLVDWTKVKIKIPTTVHDWPNPNQPLIAGVNTFGITGTNAHAIIQEAPNILLDKSDEIHRLKYILPISANDKSALQEYLKLYDDAITAENYINYTKNIAFHKANLKERLAISFTNYQELQSTLQNAINNIDDENIIHGFSEDINQKIVFVFPGQGSQWLGMALNLYQNEIVFKQTIDECTTAFAKYTNWNLIDILNTNDEDLFQQIDIVQPTLVAVEIALAKWWMSLGIQPFAVVGHSMGEVAAAYIANTISLDAAAKIICNRSQLMKQKRGEGAMAYIALSVAETQQLIGDKSDEVAIAVVNSPNSTVISGDTNAIQQIVDLATTKDIFARLIKVDVASHSQQMDSVLNDLNDALIHLDNKNSNIPFYSTVEATLLNGENLDANYWLKNLRNTVQFGKTIQQLIDDGATIFIEMSPHPVLTQAVQENIEAKQSNATTIYSLEKNKNETVILYNNLCAAYCNGVAPNWKKFYGTYYEKIELPNYPWQKEYYWLEDNTTQLQKDSQLTQALLTQLSFDDTITPTYLYQSAISIDAFPFLQDHKIAEAIVFPATAFLEIVNEVAQQSFQLDSFSLQDVFIEKALHLNEDTTTILHTIIQKEIENSYIIKMYSIVNDEKVIHFSAILNAKAISNNDRLITNLSDKQTIDKTQHYELTQKIKLPYGNAFQNILKIEYSNNIFISNAIINTNEFITHPALLDVALQTILPAVYLKTDQTFVPSKIAHYNFYQKPVSNQWQIEVQIQSENTKNIIADVFIYENNQLIIACVGVAFINIDEQNNSNQTSVFYQTNWELFSLDETKTTSDICFIIHNEHHLLPQLKSLNNIKLIEYNELNDIDTLLKETITNNFVFCSIYCYIQ